MRAVMRYAVALAAAAVVAVSGWGWAAARQADTERDTQQLHDSAVQVEQRQACLRALSRLEATAAKEWDPRC